MTPDHMSQVYKMEGQERRAAIYRYLRDHPAARPKDVRDKFQLSSATVYSHMQAIRRGWRPDQSGD